MITPERMEHFKELAEEYGVPLQLIVLAAQMLGPSEDYDGLVTTVEDWVQGYI